MFPPMMRERESSSGVPRAGSDVGALTTSVETNRVAGVVDLQLPAIAGFHQVVQTLKHDIVHLTYNKSMSMCPRPHVSKPLPQH